MVVELVNAAAVRIVFILLMLVIRGILARLVLVQIERSSTSTIAAAIGLFWTITGSVRGPGR